MKPPNQPDSVKARQILKRQLELMPWLQPNKMRFLGGVVRLMLDVKFQRLLVADVSNRGDGQRPVGLGTLYWLAAPGNLVRMEYSPVLAVMKSVLRSAPPKQTLAVQFSGISIWSTLVPFRL